MVAYYTMIGAHSMVEYQVTPSAASSRPIYRLAAIGVGNGLEVSLLIKVLGYLHVSLMTRTLLQEQSMGGQPPINK